LHATALVAALIAGPFLIAAAPDAWIATALTVYVVSIIGLFGVSAAFHRIKWAPAARRRMRRLDHSTIFIAISGAHTRLGRRRRRHHLAAGLARRA
jgi:hemolysin III